MRPDEAHDAGRNEFRELVLAAVLAALLIVSML